MTIITSSAALPTSYGGGQLIDNATVRIFDIPYSNRFGKWARLFAFAHFAVSSTLSACSCTKVDVVFATSTPLTIALPAVIAKLFHRCPMVFEVRDLWPEVPIAIGALRNPVEIWVARKLARLAYLSSTRIIALSPGIRDGIVATGIDPDKVVVVPNASDNELFDVPATRAEAFFGKHPNLKGRKLVVYVGRIGLINGVEYLAEIARQMMEIDPSVGFLVVGDGANRELLERRGRDLGVLENNFWMLPPIPKREVPDLLAAASVASSLFIDVREMWSNSANKFFDALAAGKPVMINYGGWHADLVMETGAGFVIPPRDPQGAARILFDFLSDRDRLARASEAARRLAMERFDRSQMSKLAQLTLEHAVATRAVGGSN